MPAIALSLTAAEDQVALALAVYLIGMALPMLLWGSLGERLGRKPVLLAALALYALASAAIPSAYSLESFLGLRLVQGLGAGGVSVMARVLVRDSFSGALLAKGLSWLGMTFVIALGIGQFVGSLLQVAFGWEAIFYGLAIAAVGLMIALQRVVFATLEKAAGHVSAWRIYGTILRHPAFLRPVGGRFGLRGDHRVQYLRTVDFAGPFRVERGAIWLARLADQRGVSGGGVDGQSPRRPHRAPVDDELGRGVGDMRQRDDVAGQPVCQWAGDPAVAAVLPGGVRPIDELSHQPVAGQ